MPTGSTDSHQLHKIYCWQTWIVARELMYIMHPLQLGIEVCKAEICYTVGHMSYPILQREIFSGGKFDKFCSQSSRLQTKLNLTNVACHTSHDLVDLLKGHSEL